MQTRVEHPIDRIRFARLSERAALEALQRRASLVWPEYRAALAAHPEAIELAPALIRARGVRVAERAGRLLGFAAITAFGAAGAELDSLFVEPACMHAGIGRRLLRDAARRARRRGARTLEVTAMPAAGFYSRLGFSVIGRAETRFGPAVRMRLELARPPAH